VVGCTGDRVHQYTRKVGRPVYLAANALPSAVGWEKAMRCKGTACPYWKLALKQSRRG
jgi:hypothetical protein